MHIFENYEKKLILKKIQGTLNGVPVSDCFC